MKRIIVYFILISPFPLIAANNQGYYRFPAIYENTIVFTAEGDLWKVSINGGVATRLTTHHGTESHPAISQDGSQLAFSAQYEGPTEVYTMPLGGGLPRRQTYDGGSAIVVGWTSDGKILYSTQKYSTLPNTQLVSLGIKTNKKEIIPLSQASDGTFNSTGSTLFFTRLPFQGSHTKRYKGGTAQNIWKFTFGSKEAVPLTSDYPGTSKNPLWWEGRIYFVSDRDGTMNIWSMKDDGSDFRQHTFHKGLDINYPSLYKGQIVYQLVADLYLYDISSSNNRKLSITLASDFGQMREKWVKNPMGYLTSVHISPNGDRIAMTARGQVFVAPAEEGRLIEVTRKEGVRFRDARFMPDGKSILLLCDESGELEFWEIPANGVGNGKALTKDGNVLRFQGISSPDGKWFAYTDKNFQLWIYNFEREKTKRIAVSENFNFFNLTWSPDSKWLAYVVAADNMYTQIKLYDSENGETTTLTSDRVESFSPAWNPDGKWLYFLSNRNFQSLVWSPWGSYQPEPFFDKTTKIYMAALTKKERSPFLPDDEVFLAAKEKKDNKKDKDKSKEKDTEKEEEVSKVTAPSASLNLDPFYKKYVDAWGIPVFSSDKVADEALWEVKYLMNQLLSARPDILKGMAETGVKIIVIGATEQMTDIPEYSDRDPKLNRRARGLGGRTTSCGEENLLNYEGDRYVGENIFLHEFAHCIHRYLRRAEPGFQDKLNALYQEATSQGLFENTYAGTNASEYWAEGVQGYLDCNRQSRTGKPDRVHNHVDTREELQAYDPNLFKFIDDTFRHIEWRYAKYADREKAKSEESDKEQKKVEEIKEEKDSNEDKTVKVAIELKGIQNRIIEVPVPAGDYSSLSVNDKHLFWVETETSLKRKRSLKALKIKNKDIEAKTLIDDIKSYELSLDKKKLMIQKNNDIYIIDASDSAPSTLAKHQVDLKNWTFSLNPHDEWRQMFVDAWRLERDYFYDPNLHGVDYNELLNKYLPYVSRVTDRDELNDLIAHLVSELSALHIFVSGGDKRKGQDNINQGSLGAILARDEQNGGYRIEHIYKSDPDYIDRLSPLAKPEVNVNEKDIITAINGTSLLKLANPAVLLKNQVGKQVLLTLTSSKNKKSYNAIVKPISPGAERNLRYNEWEYERRLFVEKKTNGEIGYVHLRAMGGGNYTEWVENFYPVFNRKGLIIDVRHNRGGNIDSWILEKLLRRAWFYWKPRVGKPYWNMQYAFRGHMVVLCNERTASDGEAFTEGFRRLGLGKVIGTRTWGGEIWLSYNNRLVDKGIASAAQTGVYGPEGEWLIEGHGVEPDIVVDNLPHKTFKGKDAQLKFAIKYLKEKIQKEPVEVPKPPLYPDKSLIYK